MAEFVYLEPLEDEFDLEEVRTYLATFPYAFADALKPSIYFLCGNAATADYYRKKREENPNAPYPWVGLISVENKLITVGQKCEEDQLLQTRQFVENMIKHYRCKITDDFGNDWTEQCKENIDVLYED